MTFTSRPEGTEENIQESQHRQPRQMESSSRCPLVELTRESPTHCLRDTDLDNRITLGSLLTKQGSVCTLPHTSGDICINGSG